MATPPYKGAGQPPQADDGFWAGLGSWFGGGTPAYKSAPPKTANTDTSTNTIASAVSPNPSAVAQAIDTAGLSPGPFVVVVPRGVVAPCDLSDPQSDDQQQ